MEDLKFIIGQIVREFARIGWLLTTGNLNMAGLMAETLEAIVGTFSLLLESIRRLAETDFERIVQGDRLARQITIVRNIINTIVREFSETALDLDEELAPAITATMEATRSVINLIVPLIEAMTFLSETDFSAILGDGYHLKDQIVILRNIVRTTMREFAEAAIEMDGVFAEAIGAYATAAGAVFEMIEGVVVGVAFLSDFDFGTVLGDGYHLRDQIILLRNIVRTTMREFGAAASEISSELIGHLQDYIAAVEIVFGMVEEVISTITLIADYPGISDLLPKLESFRSDLLTVATVLIDALKELATDLGDLITEAGAVSEAVIAVLGVLGPAFDALAGFADFVGIDNVEQKMTEFAEGFLHIVDQMLRYLVLISGVFGGHDEQWGWIWVASRIADQVNSVLSVFRPAFDALAGLRDYVGLDNVAAKLEEFARDFLHVVDQMIRYLVLISGVFGGHEGEEGWIGVASAIAEKVNTVISVIVPAIEALRALGETEIANVEGKISALMAEVVIILEKLGEVFVNLDPNLVDLSLEFATNLATALDQVRAAMSHMNALLTEDTPEGVQGVLQQLLDILRTAVTPAYDIGVEIGNALINGITYAIGNGLSQVQDAVNAIMEGLGQPGLGAAATVGEGGGGSGNAGMTTNLNMGGLTFNTTIQDQMSEDEFTFRVLDVISRALS
jgi:hypothetical protein